MSRHFQDRTRAIMVAKKASEQSGQPTYVVFNNDDFEDGYGYATIGRGDNRFTVSTDSSLAPGAPNGV